MTHLEDFLKNHTPDSSWDVLRTERTVNILPPILEKVEGDILEIGAFEGRTTKVFCEIAEKFGRKVIVMDPWDGRQEGTGDSYNNFMTNCKDLKNLVVHRHGSQTIEAIGSVQNEKFAYILIDGLHTYDAVKADLENYKHLVNIGGVICIDDWTGPYAFSPEIERAVREYKGDNFQLLTGACLIEAYLVRLW